MLNACYDLLTDGIGVVPYACAGVGGNFVSVVDGHINPKFAYRVKAGLSYALTPEISAFAGAFYHKVLGDGDYDELPLSPIADYTGPAGKNKDTGIASFTFAYFGGFVQKLGLPIMTGVILGSSIMAIFGKLAWPAIVMLVVFTAIFFGAGKLMAKFAAGLNDTGVGSAENFKCVDGMPHWVPVELGDEVPEVVQNFKCGDARLGGELGDGMLVASLKL
ncbi:hypothetical protein GH714_042935 [Hevea brasiliensis]|uniref:Msp4/OMP-like domain-containing protein n=1 Tax=Hevea brasiliensis TaxID=3981 RepID=A0A6A6JZW3_HEVBR|nr:hypothetical protein GH714_042935 [Hevea brasiliensis]